jgi:ADP-ribosyl-[dinitrogen reductase] hydrolase
MSSILRDKVHGCIVGLCAGDALSMPVHWYYNPLDIKNDFGRIVDYQEPKKQHPSSIMQFASTGGHGRGTQDGDIIGKVILHGKKQFWGDKTRSIHYHQGMTAGQNTLNIRCARLLWKSIAQRGTYDPKAFIDDYVKFMTTPGTHNDTYAESYHRDFFKNWSQGKDPILCAGEEG